MDLLLGYFEYNNNSLSHATLDYLKESSKQSFKVNTTVIAMFQMGKSGVPFPPSLLSCWQMEAYSSGLGDPRGLLHSAQALRAWVPGWAGTRLGLMPRKPCTTRL